MSYRCKPCVAAASLFLLFSSICNSAPARESKTTLRPDPFLSYVVSVRSMHLVTTSGQNVEVSPWPVMLDLAQVINLDEAVNLGLVPVGDYAIATLQVDFSRTEITAPGANGSVVKLTPYDTMATPLTGIRTVNILLNGQDHFVVSPRTAALQALDTRLSESNSIDAANAMVTVGDTWKADVVASGNRWVRLAGKLTPVYTSSISFILSVSGKKAYNTVATGDLSLEVTPTTEYSIGGQTLRGSAGESALATYPKGTSITATGSLLPDGKTLVASLVSVN